MSSQYGVWSHIDGGFVSTQCWSPGEAEEEKTRILDEDADLSPDEFAVMAVCADHEDQPEDGCEECASEE